MAIEEPAFIAHRLAIFDKLYAEQTERLRAEERKDITITLPDGSTKPGVAFETTPYGIAESISKSLSEKAIVARLDGTEVWDLTRPLEESCKLEILTFDHEEAKKVYWHSTAHILGEASELYYGAHLAIGPPIQDGFYYEMSLPKNGAVKKEDYTPLESSITKIFGQKQPFQRLVAKKEDLLEMFKHNKFKIHIISTKIPDGTSTTVYRCGPLIDLCRGPHVPHTGRIKQMMITKNSSSYWLGDAKNESLQRIYGISFPDKNSLKLYKKFLEEAAARDHRKIGRDQELFFFHELSPGSPFILPHGQRIVDRLHDYIRSEYRKRGFTLVTTPNMFNHQLWVTSGHWQNYLNDMFTLEVEKEKFALKPMNCPGHCLIFAMKDRSYRELPMRLAEFGVLHRNEASGALSGLTRVRRFVQDDAHVFCTLETLEEELMSNLDFLETAYKAFGFEFSLELSTRPDNAIGDIATWDNAERILTKALNRYGKEWKLNEGDGAFYGPKIDIEVFDALKRKHQCATIQVDFQLPDRFDLKYRTQVQDKGQENVETGQEAYSRPVIIHRAVLGSLERMFAILCEHFAGRWPFWLSPRQLIIIPISHAFDDYAKSVSQRLWDAGYYADSDLSDVTLNKKVRNAEIAGYNFTLVVGSEEKESESVNLRMRDNPATKKKGEMMRLEKLMELLKALTEKKPTTDSFE